MKDTTMIESNGHFYIKYNSETCSQAYCSINLDVSTGCLARNALIYLLSTSQSLLSEWREYSIVRP